VTASDDWSTWARPVIGKQSEDDGRRQTRDSDRASRLDAEDESDDPKAHHGQKQQVKNSQHCWTYPNPFA
jgi:hypothetical protein